MDFFAYPSGRYNPTVEAAVRAAGYMGATTTQPGQATRAADPYALPRVRVTPEMSPAQLLALVREPAPRVSPAARRSVAPARRRSCCTARARPASRSVVGRLLAVQAQDLRAARLALRARTASAHGRPTSTRRSPTSARWSSRGSGAARCTSSAATTTRGCWGSRRPRASATSRRRLGQEGVAPDDAERAVKIVERALADDGPADASRAGRAHRRREGIRTEGQATPHLLMLAALRGLAVLGPLRDDGAHAFALTRDWLGAPAPRRSTGAERDAALAELARRYLAGHGPAAPADLAAWSGLPLRDARAGLKAIASELAERDDDLVDLAAREPAPDAIPARLLAAFDPYLLGWKDRAFAVPARTPSASTPAAGCCAPRRPSTASRSALGARRAATSRLEPFGRLPAGARAALEADADDVARFAQAS